MRQILSAGVVLYASGILIACSPSCSYVHGQTLLSSVQGSVYYIDANRDDHEDLNLSGLRITLTSFDPYTNHVYSTPHTFQINGPTTKVGQKYQATYSASLFSGQVEIKVKDCLKHTSADRITHCFQADDKGSFLPADSTAGLSTIELHPDQPPGQHQIHAGWVLPSIELERVDLDTSGTSIGCAVKPQFVKGMWTHGAPIAVLDGISGGVIRNATIVAYNPCAGEDARGSVLDENGIVKLVPRPARILFLDVQAPGYRSQPLFLLEKQGEVVVFDHTGKLKPVQPRLNLSLMPDPAPSAPPLPPTELRYVDLDPARTMFLDSAALRELPLPLFRDPDRLLGLAPGFAPAPQTFGDHGPV